MDKYLSTRIAIGRLREMEQELNDLREIKELYIQRKVKDVRESVANIESGMQVYNPIKAQKQLNCIRRVYPFLLENEAIDAELKSKIESILEKTGGEI